MIERPQPKSPIPPHAKRVFKGVIFDVYQWEQEMFDGSKATFERMKRLDTVIVFPVLPDGRIILTKQEQPGGPPFIAGAGGRMDKEGEDPLAAAKREMREETGYEAGEMTLWHSEQPIGKIDYAIYVFIAKRLKQVGGPELDAGEKIELYPVTFDEFLDIAPQDNFAEREVIPMVLEAKLDPQKKEELRKLFSA